MDERVRTLTPRERECLLLVPELYSSKRIADRFGVEPASVDKTIHRAMRKLGVHSRSEAAAMLLAAGPPPSINLDGVPGGATPSIPCPVGGAPPIEPYPVHPEAEGGFVREDRRGYGPPRHPLLDAARRFLLEPGGRDDLTFKGKLRGVFIWFLLGVFGVSMLAAAISEVTRTFYDLAVHGIRR